MTLKHWKRMAVPILGAVAIFSAAADVSAGETPGRQTFYKDILPILQENCQICHRPSGPSNSGMVAPMAFMTYREVRPWAKAIVKEVRERTMPPWHASEIHAGQFDTERHLSDEQIAAIANWARTGAVAGNPADAPEAITWPDEGTGWAIGVPDLIVPMPEPYLVADDVEDLYVTFNTTITEEQHPEARYMRAVEFRSGSEAVHHIIARPLGGIAPGTGPSISPEGFGTLLKLNTEVSFQMHYHKEPGPGTAVWDQSSIGIQFHPKGYEVKFVGGGGPGNIGNMGFEIPPGNGNWAVGAAHTYAQDTYILSYLPHLHLRGKSTSYTAYYPDGSAEVLLDVPKYDFNWQHSYRYKEPKLIPAGTRIEVLTYYDNSEERAEWVGFNPKRAIRFGGPTTDEMMLGWISTYLRVEDAEVEN